MKVAILGFGVVGGGVYELLRSRPEFTVKYVLVRRPHEGLGAEAVSDMETILRDPEVELVVEALGGLHPAFDYVSGALKAGKHVVTSNKAMVAAFYNELAALSAEHGAAVRCAGSVGGGIPWISELEQVRRRDRILAVGGIVNGTTNYILDLMTRQGRSFEAALSAAQELGYAELDPTADIDGWDIRRKLVISANLAFDVSVREEDIPMAGIRGLTAEDIAAFRSAGLTCKMLASAVRWDGGVAAFVEPTLLRRSSPEAAVPLNFNRISLRGEKIGTQSFSGQGAGRFPTASNMLQDILDIQDGRGGFYGVHPVPCSVDNHAVRHPYYLRTATPDVYRDLAVDSLGPGIVTKSVSVAALHERAGDCSFLAALPENWEEKA